MSAPTDERPRKSTTTTSGLSFFRNLSEREKQEAEQQAAVILELTRREDADSCEGSTVGATPPRSDEVPNQVVIPNSLVRILEDVESLADTTVLPCAIAELASIYQERSREQGGRRVARTPDSESTIQRLEQITETLLLMQQQQYVETSNGPSGSISISDTLSQHRSSSSRSGKDPPEDSGERTLKTRKSLDPPADPPGDDLKLLSKETKLANFLDDSDGNVVVSQGSSYEASVTDHQITQQNELQISLLEDPVASPQEPKKSEATTSNQPFSVDDTSHPSPPSLTSNPPPTKAPPTKDQQSEDGNNIAPQIMDAIVDEVLKKLNATTNASAGHLSTNGREALQILVKDATDKMNSQIVSETSKDIPNPLDFIIERLSPPNFSHDIRPDWKDPPSKSGGYDDNDAASNSSEDRKPKAVSLDEETKPPALAVPRDPPEVDEKLVAKASKDDNQGASATAGAFRVAARVPGEVANTNDAVDTFSTGNEQTEETDSDRPTITSDKRGVSKTPAASVRFNEPVTPLVRRPSFRRGLSRRESDSKLNLPKNTASIPGARRSGSEASERSVISPNLTQEATASREESVPSSILIEANSRSLAEARTLNDDLVDNLVQADIVNTDRDQDIFQLTSAVISLQQEITRREREIPQAEAVAEKSCCTIL